MRPVVLVVGGDVGVRRSVVVAGLPDGVVCPALVGVVPPIDVVVVGADVVVTGMDVVVTGRDVVVTGRDVVVTGRDVVVTGRDVVVVGTACGVVGMTVVVAVWIGEGLVDRSVVLTGAATIGTVVVVMGSWLGLTPG
ncbi:hypothetical protein [Nocardia sp. NPDC004123]